MESEMAKVTIYQFQVYDIREDTIVKSKRWGTRKAIVEIAYGKVLEDTAIEVDESAIQSDIRGFSIVGFNPHPRCGFQTSVRS
jgi:hypothetical protein